MRLLRGAWVLSLMTARDRSAEATSGTESDDDAQAGTAGGDDTTHEGTAEATDDDTRADAATDDDARADGATDDDGSVETNGEDGATDGDTTETSDDGATDGGADDAEDEGDDGPDGENGPDSVPEVSLTLYQLTVSVTGQASDDLTDVEESAMRLMDYLVEKSGDLEDHPDNRGLG